ncbi:carbohydrate kinase [Aquibium sp. A9E412]|uniref:carbohydrate kinase family protein n=1 Tax=Aquibium sp. A9E412 TaxID=2976767 RepID=UPI0025B06BF2|nr:carbohydrate kinase [Aquibium sp. A9E412]MDN2565186.1 carbohydrate kinase [Aquibium sp. A9E412]
MILCCGEALIDMLPCESAEGLPAFAPQAGGSVFNTAVALGRLGAPVGFFGGLSSDFFGDILRDTLVGSGVDLRHAVRCDRPTTLAFVQHSGGRPRYAFFDEASAGRMLTRKALPALADDTDAVFFGGISLAAEPVAGALEALLVREARRRVVMLDMNVRPAFVADAARYRARLARLVARCDILKLSHEDLAWYAGPGDPEAQARALLQAGPSVVLLTRGADGASAHTAAHRLEAAPPPTAVVDTVGAGDAFDAGVLAVLQARALFSRRALRAIGEADLAAALAAGVEVAAMTVARRGANPPWRDELAGDGAL